MVSSSRAHSIQRLPLCFKNIHSLELWNGVIGFISQFKSYIAAWGILIPLGKQMLFIFQIGFPLHWTQISISTINITFIVLEWTQFQLRSKWCPHYFWLQQFCIAKTFTCVICRNSFCFSNSSAVTVAVRILRHKKNSANMTKKPSNAVKTPYSCNQCSFTSNRSRSLKNTCRCTVAIILFACTQCEFSTKQSGSLTRHKQTQSEEKNFSCSQCTCNTPA